MGEKKGSYRGFKSTIGERWYSESSRIAREARRIHPIDILVKVYEKHCEEIPNIRRATESIAQ